MCAEATRIGVLGGTFDPIHLGHIESAHEIAAAFSLDKVLVLLSARPPHKNPEEAAPAAQRWEMVRLAVAGDPLLEACDLELRREGPSYTVDTLRELRGLHPGSHLFLILGIDAYEEVDSWSRPGELPALASIVVTTRPGRDCPAGAPLPPVAARADACYDPRIGLYVHSSGHAIHGHRIRGVEVSATDIRRRARLGLPIAHLTGDAVARFILEHRLYGAGSDSRPTGADGAHNH
jgi:nicotinate-nucleotide adenylyltransferase